MLELTLKHVKALSGLLEQQQQKIIALQNDLQIGKFDPDNLLHLSEILPRKIVPWRWFVTSGFSSNRWSRRWQRGEHWGGVPFRVSLVCERGPPLSRQPRKQQGLNPFPCHQPHPKSSSRSPASSKQPTPRGVHPSSFGETDETRRRAPEGVRGPGKELRPRHSKDLPSCDGGAERQWHRHWQRLWRRARKAWPQIPVDREPREGRGAQAWEDGRCHQAGERRATGQEVEVRLLRGWDSLWSRGRRSWQLHELLPQPAPVLPPLLPPPSCGGSSGSLSAHAGEVLVPRGHAGYVPGHEWVSTPRDTSLLSGDVPEGRVSSVLPEPHGLLCSSQSVKAGSAIELGNQRLNCFCWTFAHWMLIGLNGWPLWKEGKDTGIPSNHSRCQNTDPSKGFKRSLPSIISSSHTETGLSGATWSAHATGPPVTRLWNTVKMIRLCARDRASFSFRKVRTQCWMSEVNRMYGTDKPP